MINKEIIDEITQLSSEELKEPKIRTKYGEMLIKDDLTEDDLVKLFIKMASKINSESVDNVVNILYFFKGMLPLKDLPFVNYDEKYNWLIEFKPTFYKKILSRLDDMRIGAIFPYLPAKVQTVKDFYKYFEFKKEFGLLMDASLREFKNGKLKDTVILDLMDKYGDWVIRTINKEWWTKKLVERMKKHKEHAIVVPPKFWDDSSIESFGYMLRNKKFRVDDLDKMLKEGFLKKKKIREEFLKNISPDFKHLEIYKELTRSDIKVLVRTRTPRFLKDFRYSIPSELWSYTRKLLQDKAPALIYEYGGSLEELEKGILQRPELVDGGSKATIVRAYKREAKFPPVEVLKAIKIPFSLIDAIYTIKERKKFTTPEVAEYFMNDPEFYERATNFDNVKISVPSIFKLLKYYEGKWSKISARLKRIEYDPIELYIYLAKRENQLPHNFINELEEKGYLWGITQILKDLVASQAVNSKEEYDEMKDFILG